MEPECPQNGTCSEVKILTNSYKMLNDKLEDIRTENKSMHEENKESIRRLHEKIDKNNQDVLHEMKSMRQDVKNDFVSKVEFEPVRKIVYGIVKISLSAILLSVLATVIYTQVAK